MKKTRGATWALTAVLTVHAAAADWFTDRAAGSGLDFFYYNGMSGEYYFVENLGGGVALFDYDNDGDLDVYFTQGHLLGKGKSWKDALFPPPAGYPMTDRLFRNDLQVKADGTRILHFTDVTRQAGIDARGYGMGVAAGDIDNDGDTDLFVTNWGRNQLWRNEGDGTFKDVTAPAGVDAPGWGVSAAFADYDRDGDLDLYVANYVHFDTEKNKRCYGLNGAPDYCAPQQYKPMRDRLYRNRGDGTFEDVSEASGIAKQAKPGLGVIAADFNGDGWIDFYVANDGETNNLWINQRDGTFKDEAFLAGVAVNMEGAAEASMGVDAGDFDNDGDEDLFMTHLLGETNTLYVNDGQGWFEDRTLAIGLGAPSKGYTAFGTAWFDYDNDGWLDLIVANGDVRVMPILARQGDKYPLRQPNQLFHNVTGKRFEDVTKRAGKVFERSEVSRGVAVGDIDNDGDLDVVLVNSNGPARLLINELGNRAGWIGLRLLDRHGRDAYGARIRVDLDRGPTLWRRVHSDGSYASAHSPRLLIGLGAAKPKILTVTWPDGKQERWLNPTPGRWHTLHRGDGQPVAPASKQASSRS